MAGSMGRPRQHQVLAHHHWHLQLPVAARWHGWQRRPGRGQESRQLEPAVQAIGDRRPSVARRLGLPSGTCAHAPSCRSNPPPPPATAVRAMACIDHTVRWRPLLTQRVAGTQVPSAQLADAKPPPSVSTALVAATSVLAVLLLLAALLPAIMWVRARQGGRKPRKSALKSGMASDGGTSSRRVQILEQSSPSSSDCGQVGGAPVHAVSACQVHGQCRPDDIPRKGHCPCCIYVGVISGVPGRTSSWTRCSACR